MGKAGINLLVPTLNAMFTVKCATIDDAAIFLGRLGSCLILRSPAKKSTAELPQPPATIMPEIFPGNEISNILNHVKLILISSLM